jgi:3'-phosphoadenosine 5'-phosphosulfate sulfotransferase (PAPS reductase)/FAD synthetase
MSIQHIILGNFGNHSLAAMQALLEKDLPALHFIYVETGWAAASWPERVLSCSNYARSQGVLVHKLNAQSTFTEMVVDRKQFPSRKFQWCASFLKGLTILNFLDDYDSACEALIVSGKRRKDSRRFANLREFEHNYELYQGRTVWHPLWQTNDEQFRELIKRTGQSLLPQQSLECSPCIHASVNELSCLDSQSTARLEALEQYIGKTMFQYPINHLGANSNTLDNPKGLLLQQFDLGCGAAWGCGE